MTSHEKRVNALMRLHGMTKAAAEKRAKQIEGAAKKNPAPRAVARGGNTKKYVNRPSQAGDHSAPSARLKARRKKALTAPKGVFPNPSKRAYTITDVKALMVDSLFKPVNGKTLSESEAAEKIIRQAVREGVKVSPGVVAMIGKKNPVQKKLQSRPKPSGRLKRKVFTVEAKHGDTWVTEGIFPSESSAREYAHALDAKYGNKMYIRVTV